ncbi:unnamed protein product [Leptosia nina]|uniref:Uncharacterized protein n=1 Tax=Leptosia nina TaxID=320188 RepID=A0AAV1J0V0_9NEOP
MFAKISLIVLLYLNLTSFGTYGMTAEQKAMIHAHFEKIGADCIKEYKISVDDIKSLRTKKMPTGENAPCFLACILKNIGVMDDKGMLQKETVMELAKKVFNDDEELKLMEDYLHSCSHINNESVSDGEKGCERATLAYKCMTENASQFGLEL